MRYLLAILLLIACASALTAQKDSIPPAPAEGNTDLLEDLLQNTDAEAAGDFNTLFESLADYLRKPLNINKADEEDLRDLLLLNDVQIAGLLRHRAIAHSAGSSWFMLAINRRTSVPISGSSSARRKVACT